MTRVLNKGAEFANDNNLNADDFVGMSLHSDMLPFLFQVNCARMHTVDALAALESGVFTPPKSTTPRDYKGLQDMLVATLDELKSVPAEKINGYQGKSMLFKMGDMEIPFTAENFILSFSIPNLNFHATTAYDILRAQGAQLGKADYLGKMRVGV
jgi:hypothetical protein